MWAVIEYESFVMNGNCLNEIKNWTAHCNNCQTCGLRTIICLFRHTLWNVMFGNTISCQVQLDAKCKINRYKNTMFLFYLFTLFVKCRTKSQTNRASISLKQSNWKKVSHKIWMVISVKISLWYLEISLPTTEYRLMNIN